MAVEEHTIEVGGAPVYYRSVPASGTPALYLHSAPTSSDDWVGALERTGGLAPDLPGFGRSGKGGHLDYTPAGYVAFADAFLDATATPRASIVGHGWGAGFALLLAAAHPARVERLVLIDAVPLLAGEGWPGFLRWLRAPGLGELIMGSTPRRALYRMLRRAAATPQAWPEDRLAAVWDHFDQGTQRAILRLHRSLSAPPTVDLTDIEQPILILWGARDPWLRPEIGRRLAEALPDARCELVEGAGHWPWLDDPATLERIARFAHTPG